MQKIRKGTRTLWDTSGTKTVKGIHLGLCTLYIRVSYVSSLQLTREICFLSWDTCHAWARRSVPQGPDDAERLQCVPAE